MKCAAYTVAHLHLSGIVCTQNSKTSKTNFVGNVKKIGFRSGQNGIKNIYLDLYEEDNTKTSIAFFTDEKMRSNFLLTIN